MLFNKKLSLTSINQFSIRKTKKIWLSFVSIPIHFSIRYYFFLIFLKVILVLINILMQHFAAKNAASNEKIKKI